METMEDTKDGRIGKRILVIFEDGQNRDGTSHISKKEGVCTNLTDIEVELDHKDILNRSRIIRMEIMEDIK